MILDENLVEQNAPVIVIDNEAVAAVKQTKRIITFEAVDFDRPVGPLSSRLEIDIELPDLGGNLGQCSSLFLDERFVLLG